MLVELRQKSQLTIPAEFVQSMKLNVGDQFEVIEKDGMLCLIPVAVYPKSYVAELESEISALKEQIANGTRKVFDNVDDLFASLDEE